jgi:hypothetical protein
MMPPVYSASPESARPLFGRGGSAFAASAAIACSAALALVLSACGGDDWPDRDPLVIENAPVDSLEFLPRGSRFLLADSPSSVRVRGYHLGYACTEVLAFRLDRRGTPSPSWSARIRLRLPPAPTCAQDTAARDSTLALRFAASDGPVIRLADSLGVLLDTATLVRGVLSFDSLVHKAPALATFNGRFHYRDTSGLLRRELATDSLGACESLNHAEFRRRGDTTVVRYSWVTREPASPSDSCAGPVRREALEPAPSLP